MSATNLLLKNLINTYEHSKITLPHAVLSLIISMLEQNGLYKKNTVLYNKIDVWQKQYLYKNQLQNQLTLETPLIFADFNLKNTNDDLIGSFYQSIRTSYEKTNTGSYYTPPKLLKHIQIPPNKTVIDPCCGSGAILLKILSKNHNPNLVFARDIDEIALLICEANLAMFFNNPNCTPHICKKDLIFGEYHKQKNQYENEQFDFIVSNPPWGGKLSNAQKKQLLLEHPDLQTTETFSIALKECIKKIAKNGELVFFLPHAFLNVAAHKNVRNYILQQQADISIELLGNAFKNVMSKSIKLIIKKKSITEKITITDTKNCIHTLQKKSIVPPDFIICATINQTDQKIIQSIYSIFTERLNAQFALGIVTGNNERFILKDFQKNGQNQNNDSIKQKIEPIFRGKDIMPYSFCKPDCWIRFTPLLFQQVAPEQFYRTKKVVYRFIGNKIVCVFDTHNNLILNSANLFISNNYPMETIVCLFNSPIYSFIFTKKFHSIKILKSHLQQLPLPALTKKQHAQFLEYYNAIKTHQIDQTVIDAYICKLAKISKAQFDYIMGVKPL